MSAPDRPKLTQVVGKGSGPTKPKEPKPRAKQQSVLHDPFTKDTTEVLESAGFYRAQDTDIWTKPGPTAKLTVVVDDERVRVQSRGNTSLRPGKDYSADELREALRSDVDGEDVVTTLSDVEPEEVHWLWEGRIPLGKLTVLEGDPKSGKSTMTVDLAARVSTGSAMPDETPSDLDGPAHCILMTAEDGLADTVRPRLDAAGADPSRVHSWDGIASTRADKTVMRMPSMPLDVARLEALVIRHAAKLVIIDVLAAYLDEKVNSWNDKDVRRALAPLAKMAERTGAAVVVLRHLNKGIGTKAMYRGGGSIGISGQARSILLVGLDPNDETKQKQILAVTACNLAATAPSLNFKLTSIGPRAPVCIDWSGGPSILSADDLLIEPVSEDERADRKEIVGLLTSWTQNGPIAVSEAKRKLRELGITASDATLKRARRDAGVEVGKPSDFGGKRHYWRPGTVRSLNEGSESDRTVEPSPTRGNGSADSAVRSPIGVAELDSERPDADEAGAVQDTFPGTEVRAEQ